MIRRAPLLAVVAALVLALAAWFLLISPQRDEQALLREEITTLVAQQNAKRLEIARLEEIKANELDVRADIARLEQYITDGTAQPSVIRQFQLVADASGVEITSLTFSEPVAVAGAPAPAEPSSVLASVPTTLVVEGGYFQLTDFLRRAEAEMPRAVLIDSVTITEAPQPASFPVLSATLSSRLFTVVPATAVAPSEGAAPPPGATPSPGASPAPSAAEPAPAGRVTPLPEGTA